MRRYSAQCHCGSSISNIISTMVAKNLFEIVAYLQKIEGTVLEAVERAAA